MRRIVILLILAAGAVLWAAPCLAATLEGKFVEDQKWTGQRYEPGSVVPYCYYLSPGAAAGDNAVYVLYEAKPQLLPKLEGLVREGVIPGGLFLLVNAGTLPAPALPEGEEDFARARNMRPEEFDQNGVEFTNLIIEELIPHVARSEGIGISPNPDRHFVYGASSGGALAWYGLWYRNDFFRRGFLSSPTFSAMRGGEEPMVLVRKTEPRPIRVYITAGTVEPDYYFGDSFLAALGAVSALEYAGYAVRSELFAQGTHGYARTDPELWDRMMRWLFAPERVEKPTPCARLAKIIPADSFWKEEAAALPDKTTRLQVPAGRYQLSRDGALTFLPKKGKRLSIGTPGAVSALALSSDLWRLYLACSGRRFVYALTLDAQGAPAADGAQLYKLAPIHEAHDICRVGCEDLCVSRDDRLFAATQLGVQTINSNGLPDFILPLPGDEAAERVWISGDKRLWVQAQGGKVYSRRILLSPHDGKTRCLPSKQRYNDGFDYARPHLPELFDPLPKGSSLPAR
ncbi:MAG: hypothetical protein IJV01_06385 [Bacteroidales bacterium]|nr:hypothetical protein [Bacteroidales bacterium]